MASTRQRRRPAPRAARRSTRRRLVAVVALVATGTLITVGAWAARRDEVPSSALPAIAGADPGVVHVHGLGVDPGDGLLYAATHLGLFRVPEDGKATRVANRYQDTMGFTVTGPGTFLGSGHPDLREASLPPLLGLIESTDRAETWQSRSLLGEVDFHALHAAHGRVYGYDSTSSTLMVSSDRETWDRRATLAMRDFAVSPAMPDTLVATTERGVVRSTDGGRTFSPLSAPALSVLAWGEAAELYGLSPTGQVLVSADGGDTWDRRGALDGEPEAFTGYDGRLYASLNRDGIYQSDDGGRTWTLRYRDR